MHTEYCGHAPGMNIKAIIRQAEKRNLEMIAITSHVFCEEHLDLIEQISNEVDKIPTSLNVIVGAEVDVDWQRTDGRLVTDKLDGIPYVLGGFHYIPGVGYYPRSLEDNPLEYEDFFKKWKSSLLGAVSNPALDTFAHPGRLFMAACELDPYFEDMLAVLAVAAEISAKNNIAWELNELNCHKVPPAYWPQWHKTLQIALDAGVKLLFGSDAHKVEDIGKSALSEELLTRLPKGSLSTPQSLGIL